MFSSSQFTDSAASWRSDGRHYYGDHPADLIAEYREPAPAGWILCKDRIPMEAPDPGSRVLALRTFESMPEVVPTMAPGFAFLEPAFVAWLPIPKFTPPPPEKKKVPLGPEDVPPGSAFRSNSWYDQTAYRQPIEVTSTDVVFLTVDTGTQKLKWSDLVKSWKISRDGGKTWEPCYREMEVD